MSIEFVSFGKIARMFREIVVTEKINGSNAAIGIVELEPGWIGDPGWMPPASTVGVITADTHATYAVYAQSRKRVITPAADNFGFARWVWEHAETLVTDLGPGLHFGEWWGSGIQCGYGLTKGEKRFSLFNVKRWEDVEFTTPGVACVPVLYRGPFSTVAVNKALCELAANGSVAAPGFMNPEGVVVYHTAANQLFKATLQNDEQPKSVAERIAA